MKNSTKNVKMTCGMSFINTMRWNGFKTAILESVYTKIIPKKNMGVNEILTSFISFSLGTTLGLVTDIARLSFEQLFRHSKQVVHEFEEVKSLPGKKPQSHPKLPWSSPIIQVFS